MAAPDDVAFARFAARRYAGDAAFPAWARLAAAGVPAAARELARRGGCVRRGERCAFEPGAPADERPVWEQECRVRWPDGYGAAPACEPAWAPLSMPALLPDEDYVLASARLQESALEAARQSAAYHEPQTAEHELATASAAVRRVQEQGTSAELAEAQATEARRRGQLAEVRRRWQEAGPELRARRDAAAAVHQRRRQELQASEAAAMAHRARLPQVRRLLQRLHAAEEEEAVHRGLEELLADHHLEPALPLPFATALLQATERREGAAAAAAGYRAALRDARIECREDEEGACELRATDPAEPAARPPDRCTLVVGPAVGAACAAVPDAEPRTLKAVQLAYGLHAAEEPRAWLAQAGVRATARAAARAAPPAALAFFEAWRCHGSGEACAAGPPGAGPGRARDGASAGACALRPRRVRTRLAAPDRLAAREADLRNFLTERLAALQAVSAQERPDDMRLSQEDRQALDENLEHLRALLSQPDWGNSSADLLAVDIGEQQDLRPLLEQYFSAKRERAQEIDAERRLGRAPPEAERAAGLPAPRSYFACVPDPLLQSLPPDLRISAAELAHARAALVLTPPGPAPAQLPLSATEQLLCGYEAAEDRCRLRRADRRAVPPPGSERCALVLQSRGPSCVRSVADAAQRLAAALTSRT